MLHGYGLSGSGSNIYTRELARCFAEQGHEVHVFCQELDVPFPVRSHTVYDRAGRPYPDCVIETSLNHAPSADALNLHIHRPFLPSGLPVFNIDIYPGYEDVRRVIDLSDVEIEGYVSSTVAAVNFAVGDRDIDIIHANHVVMMPEVARRISEKTGVPYVVMPHGSAIEYAVRQSKAMRAWAVKGLEASSGLLLGGMEMRGRLAEFVDKAILDAKPMATIPTGVDLEMFRTGLTLPPPANDVDNNVSQGSENGRTATAPASPGSSLVGHSPEHASRLWRATRGWNQPQELVEAARTHRKTYPAGPRMQMHLKLQIN